MTALHALHLRLSAERITLPQAVLLARLQDDAPCNMVMASELLGITTAGMTCMADRMVKMGLVERFQEANDRRKIYLAATVKGNEIAERILRA